MDIDALITAAKKRMKKWWSNPIGLHRPAVSYHRTIPGVPLASFDRWKWGKEAIAAINWPFSSEKERFDLIKQSLNAKDPEAGMFPPFPSRALDDTELPRDIIEEMAQEQLASVAPILPLGEAIPSVWPNFGAGALAPCLGKGSSFPVWSDESHTIWFEVARPWDELQKLELDLKSPYWQWIETATVELCKNAPAAITVGHTDLGGILDILASLRGANNLLKDLIKNKEQVHKARRQILDAWQEAYDKLWNHMQSRPSGQEGSNSWLGVWYPGRGYTIQSDFAYMLDSKRWEEFVLPDVKEQCNRLDNAIYHLDGVGQIPHLDSLLEIENLGGIQWVPGAGKDPVDTSTWLEIIVKKVLKAGKRLQLGIAADRIWLLLDRLDEPQGLYCECGHVPEFTEEMFLPWINYTEEELQTKPWYEEEFYQEMNDEDDDYFKF